MNYKIPQSWEYSESLEMLYLFYQKADELLSENTPDTYALPLHNSISLVFEIAEVFSLLKKYNIEDTYYLQYIPPIIEEFIDSLEEDYILKRLLGKRLDSIKTGFFEAEKDSTHLEIWINVFLQICSIEKYTEAYKQEICKLISTKDKEKLLYCTTNYFILLRFSGYSREHLYVSTKKYFNNNSIKIRSADQIVEYLSMFTQSGNKYSFLILMDVLSLEYLDRMSGNALFSKDLHILNITEAREELGEDPKVSELFDTIDEMNNPSSSRAKLAIVKVTDEALDPYKSIERFTEYTQFIQIFSRYYKHFNASKQIYKILLETNGKYVEIKLPNLLYKRPYLSQEVIDLRIKKLLSYSDSRFSAFQAITKAIDMHANALDSKDSTTILKGFWTASETLFSNPVHKSTRENVINSMTPIIQKTYFLKNLRNLYSILCDATDKECLTDLGICDFPSFVEYFASYSEGSAEMKKIYSLLNLNPLLRTRIYSMRKKLSTGKKIYDCLEKHETKIVWQLKRIYRMRNIATHIGTSVTGIDVAVNHLHNYFDYMVNYMLCKLDNGDYVHDTSAVVFEAKNDIRIQRELLKENKALSKDNYLYYLFGPDQNLILYDFE